MRRVTLIICILIFGTLWSGPTYSQGIDLPLKYQDMRIPWPQLPSSAFISGQRGYYLMTGSIGRSDYDDWMKALLTFEWQQVKAITIILNSPGGSAFDALAIAELIEEYKTKGFNFEVRGYGFIASGAVLILASGTKGQRFLSPIATVYLHELQVFKLFETSSTSKQKRESEFLEYIEQNYIQFILNHSGLKHDELRAMMRQETWLTPTKAIEYGLADQLTR
mgnify:CR=1 FL=1